MQPGWIPILDLNYHVEETVFKKFVILDGMHSDCHLGFKLSDKNHIVPALRSMFIRHRYVNFSAHHW